MVDYVNVIEVGCSLLIIIIFGFLCFKFHLLPMSGISPLNLFLYKVCYLCMISRNLMKRKFSELNFYPFLVGTFTTISTHIIFVLMFLVPFKDKFKNYLSAVLPCSFVNYLVIGFPIFDSIWDPNENIMVPMVALSNDLITTPIYLVLSNIYLAKKAAHDALEHNQSLNDISENDNDKKDKPTHHKKHQGLTPWKLFKHVIVQLVTNPILIGNVIGLIWAAFGWKIPTFLGSLTTFLGDEVLGICLICVGGFIAQSSIVACNWIKFIVCLIARHILMPMLAMLFAWALNLSNKLVRQCTLMAVLPTGTTSFLMSSLNGIGPGVSSTMIFWSTILCVPFLILWIFVLDQLHLFVEE